MTQVCLAELNVIIRKVKWGLEWEVVLVGKVALVEGGEMMNRVPHCSSPHTHMATGGYQPCVVLLFTEFWDGMLVCFPVLILYCLQDVDH